METFIPIMRNGGLLSHIAMVGRYVSPLFFTQAATSYPI